MKLAKLFLVLLSHAVLTIADNDDNYQYRVRDWNGSSVSEEFSPKWQVPGPPENLRVSVNLATPQSLFTNSGEQWDGANSGQDGVGNLSRKRLKLVISWEHPSGDIHPEGYNVEVRPATLVSGSDDNHSTRCSDNFHDIYAHVGYEDNIQTYEVGPDPSNGAIITYGCSYFVTVQTTPLAFPANQTANVTVSVPDCVEGFCRCGVLSPLPEPQILSVQQIGSGSVDSILPRSFQVTWNYPQFAEDLQNLTTSSVLVLEKLEHTGLGVVYRRVQLYRLKHGSLYNKNFTKSIHHLEPNSQYRIRIFAEDKHFCDGDIADFLIPTVQAMEKTQGLVAEGLLSILLPSLGAAVLLSTFAILATRKYLRRLLFTSHLTRRNSRERPAAGTPLYPALTYRNLEPRRVLPGQHVMNVLYVEKEIEEARAIGAVDDYEISPNRLKLGAQIGTGAYGRVYLALAEGLKNQPPSLLVAVKQMKKKAGPDETDDFLAEISMMKHVGRHPHIVVMLGCVTLQPPFCMVLEYVPYGDLLHYLRHLRSIYNKRSDNSSSTRSGKAALLPNRSSGSRRVSLNVPRGPCAPTPATPSSSVSVASACCSQSKSAYSGSSTQSSAYVMANSPSGDFYEDAGIDTEELQNFALQIASGMEHLEKKNITHRDLAARNILVSEGHVLKISDFGLSRRGIYVNTRTRMLPLRWLALESMRDNLYSSQSDVWAFGIVLWEICTLGGFPYPTVSDANLLTFLLLGKRLERPDNASEELYAVMLECWKADPEDRPRFTQLRSLLESMQEHHHKYVDFGEIPSSYVLPPTEEEATLSKDPLTNNQTTDTT